MFKCPLCKTFSKPNEKQVKKVVEKRAKAYENTVNRGKRSIVIKSTGWEIAKEISTCSRCSSS